MNAAGSPLKPPTARSLTGLTTLMRTLADSRSRLMSRRYKFGRMVWEKRQELIASYGGEANLSPQKLALVDDLVKVRLLQSHLEQWLFRQESLVSGRGRAAGVTAVLGQWRSLTEQASRLTDQLGIEREALVVDDFEALRQRVETARAAQTATPPQPAGRTDGKARESVDAVEHGSLEGGPKP